MRIVKGVAGLPLHLSRGSIWTKGLLDVSKDPNPDLSASRGCKKMYLSKASPQMFVDCFLELVVPLFD